MDLLLKTVSFKKLISKAIENKQQIGIIDVITLVYNDHFVLDVGIVNCCTMVEVTKVPIEIFITLLPVVPN